MIIPERISVLQTFLGEKGTADLVKTIKAYRDKYGPEYLSRFKAANPNVSEIVDLCANYDFGEAWDRFLVIADEWIDEEENFLKRAGMHAIKTNLLAAARPDIEKLHAAVRFEIDRPR